MSLIDNPDLATTPERALALECVTAGIDAATPATVVPARITLEESVLVIDGDRYDLETYDRLLVLGGGNAGATVARALETVLGDRIDDGVVVTDNPVETTRVAVRPGDHPVPSARGVESTRAVLEMATEATGDDLVLAIVTGGASALLTAPADGLELPDVQATTEALLASGCSIDELNAVRKHLSAVKGGHLARLTAPATTVGLVVSDVIGNDLEVIASGPLTPDSSSFADARSVLERYDVTVPERVSQRLRRGERGDLEETPGPDDPAFESVEQYILADGQRALEAAAAVAREHGSEPLILSSRIRGESREAAKTMAAIAEACADTGTPLEAPAVLLSGGETTVTVRGDGSGGPNQEFTLACLLELSTSNAPVSSVVVACVDTDGVDGNSGAAGAIGTPETATPTEAARRALEANDSAPFLRDRDGLIVTGPTETNVNDLRVVVVPPGSDDDGRTSHDDTHRAAGDDGGRTESNEETLE